MDVSPKAQNKQVTIHRPLEAQEEGTPKYECFGSSEKGNKILTGAIIETKCGAESEGRATYRLSYLGIYPINSDQTLTFLWITRSAYQKEHIIVVFGGSLSEPYRYRSRC